jgi:mono/diheme cytochrome c family protein
LRTDWGSFRPRLRSCTIGVALILLAGCTDMKDQSRYEPLEESSFYANGQSSRTLIPGTVARGHLDEDAHFYRGLGPDGKFARTFPMAVDAKLLARGRERFDIFCSPCHDRTGSGDGMIVRRGYKRPPSYHDPQLRGMPPGYFFDVISNGFGKMSSYAAQIHPADRWAIVAYIRALQLSQDTDAGALTADIRHRLEQEAVVDVRTQSGEDHEASGH